MDSTPVQHKRHARETALPVALNRRLRSLASSDAYLFVPLAVTLYLLTQATTAVYSPDSWAYVDIAQSIIDPHKSIGEISFVRNFVNEPWLNNSFPLLFPFLLAPFVAVLGPDSPSGAFLNIIIWFATAVVLQRTLRLFRTPQWLGIVVSLTILGLPGYLQEMLAGRTVPLSIFLLLLGLYFLLVIREKNWWLAPLLAGVFTGAAAATRFDALLVGPILITAALLGRHWKWRQAAVFVAGWLPLGLSYNIYSYFTFGKLYATESGPILRSADPAAYMNFWGLESKGALGAAEIAAKMIDRIPWLLRNSVHSDALVVLSVLGICVVVLLGFFLRSYRLGKPSFAARKQRSGILTLFIFALTASLYTAALILASGYKDVRYWGLSMFCWLVLSTILMSTYITKRRVVHVVSALAMSCFLVLTTFGFTEGKALLAVKPTTLDAQAVECLSRINGPVMVTRERLTTTTSQRLATVMDKKLVTLPGNAESFSDQDWRDLREYIGDVTFLLEPGGTIRPPQGVFKEYECR